MLYLFLSTYIVSICTKLSKEVGKQSSKLRMTFIQVTLHHIAIHHKGRCKSLHHITIHHERWRETLKHITIHHEGWRDTVQNITIHHEGWCESLQPITIHHEGWCEVFLQHIPILRHCNGCMNVAWGLCWHETLCFSV